MKHRKYTLNAACLCASAGMLCTALPVTAAEDLSGAKTGSVTVTVYDDETGAPIPESGCLDRWAKQGVLLLNSVLTVRAGMAGSHRSKGWEQITDAAIAALNAREKPMVFLLWGAFAKEKLPLITNRRHLVLQAPHPSPLSAFYGFFGCGHFAKCTEFLSQNGIAPIEW